MIVLIHAEDPILYVVILSLYSVDLFIYEVGSLLYLDVLTDIFDDMFVTCSGFDIICRCVCVCVCVCVCFVCLLFFFCFVFFSIVIIII